MPPATRRRVQPPPSLPQHFIDPESDSQGTNEEEVEDEELVERVEGEEDEEEELLDPPTTPPSPPLPAGLKEISSLASWTVSSSKPGCSIPQLRSPSTALFWQSDGPQPHLLNIHFFKLVRIVGLRLYLDFEADESYTPTRIQFLAGTGPNDLQEWNELRLEQPRGWVWVGFEGVGDAEGEAGAYADEDEDDSGSESASEGASEREDGAYSADEEDDPMDLDGVARKQRKRRRRKHAKMPVLRAFLVQIKILENHQNGKDTHLRGLQIFARDRGKREERRSMALAEGRMHADGSVVKVTESRARSRIVVPEWDRIPDIR
ncbi:galactose-binding like protein [Lepidopterella palustris CBS 459.81]|uniref:Galactose-binding like protein n=1 Tax=Lepidopterella palustris CBS 459.81 TaxID=1314670 RepID=A0A8E2JGU8_9PEZI|nr:galactose-binding like protein [Lepidopterella palustris CBS 459.81]